MALFNRNTTQRQSLGSSLGNIYARLRGLNPMGALSQFGQNFRTASGIPQDAKLWTKAGGIQLGNLPTIQNTYSSNLGDVLKMDPNLTYSFAENNPNAVLNGIKAQDVVNALAKDPTGATLGADKITALNNIGDISKSGTLKTPGQGISLGKLANWGTGIYQGGKAIKGIYDNVQSDNDLRSLKDDINISMASNPMYDMYLDASDEKLLRQMQNGTLNNSVDNIANGIMEGLPSSLLQAGTGFLAGGVPGALIGGIGGLLNSGISGYGQGTEEINAKLTGLYNKLKQAEEEYRSMKRPRGLSSAGLQSRYFNELY